MTSEIHRTDITWRLRDADRTQRLFITAFLVLLTCGYGIGLLFVGHITATTPQGITQQYLGTPENLQATEIRYAKSLQEMYTVLHNHILSLALVLFAVGGIFYFTSIPRSIFKDTLIIEPFVAIATTFGGIWLTRYVSAYFSWLVFVSGISMVGCYLVMVIVILKELWLKK